MDLRMHYLRRFKSFSSGIRGRSRTRRIIGQELSEWVLMRGYLDQGISLESMAAEIWVTREEMSAFLSESTGERFMVIRKRLRVSDAKSLLLERKDLSLAQVAYSVGFQDKSDFRRAFKDETGVTPREWREMNGKRPGLLLRSLRGRDGSHCPSPRRTS